MPFDYLWSLLVVGQDKDFIFDLAELVYNSEIEITVHDNLTTETKVVTSEYEKETHSKDPNNGGYVWVKTVKTYITKTNTVDVGLTKANVWIVDYEQEYKFEQGTPERTSTVARIHNGTKTTDTTILSSKYVSSPATTEEKTEPNSSEDNFVTLLLKHSKALNNIPSGARIIFEILEENKHTSDMVDLTKYLLYKATGTVYDGIDSYNFNVFEPGSFTTVTGIYGGTIQEKVWFALKDAGVSDVAAAGAMGNIDYESGGMNPSLVEGGYNENNGGIGICQWTNNRRGTKGRNAQLKAYAASKGVTWQDEDTQVEFLIAELTGTGPASGYAESGFQASNRGYYGENYSKDAWASVPEDESKIEYATRAFAATFERPNSKDFHNSMPERIRRAQKYYAEFKGKERSVGQYSAAEISAGVYGSYTSSSGKKFTLYLQGGNAPWRDNDYGESRSMAKAGCGPTALAIIASAYDSSITPETTRAATVRRYGIGNNSAAGNMQQVLKDVGVNVQTRVGGRNKQEVINCLKNGGQVWIVVYQDGNYTYNSHCMALLDYNASDDTVYVAHGTASSMKHGWGSLDYVMKSLKSSHDLLYVGG